MATVCLRKSKEAGGGGQRAGGDGLQQATGQIACFVGQDKDSGFYSE